MKKIVLILSIFLLTGCYDYVELNDLRIVSTMFVDYEDEKYTVNLEILNPSDKATEGSYFVNGSGKTFEEAVNNVYDNANFTPYFSHMNILVLSENLSVEGIKPLYDYLMRNIEIRKDFYFYITNDKEELLSYKTEPGESIGDEVKKMTEKNIEKNGLYRTSQFRDVIYNYLRKKPFLIGGLKIEDEKLFLEKNYVFEDNILKSSVPEEVALFVNIMEGTNKDFEISDHNTYEIHEYKLDQEVAKDKITLKFKGLARLLSIQKDENLSTKNVSDLEKEIKKEVEKLFNDVIEYSRKQNIDIFGFNHLYYLNYPKETDKSIWKNLKYEVDVDITIGEKGMIMDSLEGKYDK